MRHKSNDYLDLIAGLFKAIQGIKYDLAGFSVFPVAVLRDDIYGQIMDNDKTKWRDIELHLEWDLSKISRLLSFGINRSRGLFDEEPEFRTEWSELVRYDNVPVGFQQRKRMKALDYIARSTHMRPRDFIYYLKVCADKELMLAHDKIYPETIRSQDKTYSNFLRDELRDEIGAIIPYIDKVFNVFSHIRKQELAVDEFINRYNRDISKNEVSRLNAETVLSILFHFSVIGNKAPGRSPLRFFRYENKEARINFDDKLCIHRGLYKSLQII